MTNFFTTTQCRTLARMFGIALLLATAIGSATAAPSLMTSIIGVNKARTPFDIKSEATPVMLNRAALAKLQQQDEFEVVLPNATRHLIIFDRIEDHGGGIRSSVGYLKEYGKDFRVIITTGPSGTFGSIRTPDTIYRIVPGADGQDLLVDMTEEQKHIPFINLGNDARRVPDALNADPKNKGLPSSPARVTAQAGVPGVALLAPMPQATIDLMIVYTNGFAAQLGGGLLTRLNYLVTAANTAYIDSEVAITLRLVNSTMVNYTDAAGDGAALDAITPVGSGGVGVFSNIESIRNANGADMVSFLRAGGTNFGSGIAWLTTNNLSPNANYLYSVVTGCVAGCDSVFIHELGHNMGNAHDRATAAAQQGGTSSPNQGAYPYSFGYYFCFNGGPNNGLTCNPFVPGGCGVAPNIILPQCAAPSVNDFGTIMSYYNSPILKFSNPNILCTPTGSIISRPCGIAETDTANSANNAKSMNNMRILLQNINLTVSSTALSSSPNPSVTGQAVTFTATVAASLPGGPGTPEGTVTFLDGSTIIANCNAIPMIGGSAQCVASSLFSGSHAITAAYSGDINYNVSTSPTLTQIVSVSLTTPPGIPIIGTATPGNAQAMITFTPPASNGGSPITNFTATCNPGTLTGSATFSPVNVRSLINATPYTCSVSASNAVGAGGSSATVAVTPSAMATLSLVGVVSRKIHGTAGTFDLPIDISLVPPNITVEPRTIGSGHSVVLQFNNIITSAGTLSVVAGAMATIGASTSFVGNDVIVSIPTLADNKRITLSLGNVNATLTPAPVSMGFLIGDVNNTRSVNASDISSVKAHSGQTSNATNFKFDVNATGSISSADVSAVKARSGLMLP